MLAGGRYWNSGNAQELDFGTAEGRLAPLPGLAFVPRPMIRSFASTSNDSRARRPALIAATMRRRSRGLVSVRKKLRINTSCSRDSLAPSAAVSATTRLGYPPEPRCSRQFAPAQCPPQVPSTCVPGFGPEATEPSLKAQYVYSSRRRSAPAPLRSVPP